MAVSDLLEHDGAGQAEGLGGLVDARPRAGRTGTLISASNLAIVLAALGEHQAARELHEDTLARRRRVLGDDHPDTLTSTYNLAAVLHALGET